MGKEQGTNRSDDSCVQAQLQEEEINWREKEERLQFALEGAGDGIWDWDLRTNRVFFSRQWKAMLGFQEHEIGDALDEWDKRVHPEDRAAVYEELRKHCAGETPTYRSEHRVLCKDGRYKWILDRGKILERSPAGEPVRMVGTHADITLRKRAEEALRESEERYRNFIANASEGIFRIDLVPPVPVDQPTEALEKQIAANAIVAEVNSALSNMYGLAPEQMVGRPVVEFAPNCGTQMADMLHSPNYSIIDREEQEISSSGEPIYIIETYRGVVERGLLLRVWGVQRNITESKLAELRLRQEREFSDSLISSLPGIFFMFDSQGQLVRWNDNHAKLLEYEPEELSNKHILSLVAEEDHALVRQRMGEALGQGFASLEARIQTRTGRRVPYLLNGIGIKRGEELFILGTGIDLTARKQAELERIEIERRLLHSQKLESLGVLAGGIAHDFNNLLMAILGNLDLALLELSADSNVRDLLEQALCASRRAGDLTRQMLAYSGKGKFVLEGIDLADLVLENVHLLKASVAKAVTLELIVARGLPRIEADPGQLQQVVMNLLTNAAEAIGASGGKVTITTGSGEFDQDYLAASRLEEKPPAGRYVFLEVQDSGCGMDETTQQRLFEPFFSTKFTGRGLGMAAVLGIVRGHRGAVLVQSSLGQGSTIRVLLPAVTKDASKEPAECATGAGPRARPFSGTALIVDDEDIVRDLCVTYAKRLGFQTLAAVDGAEGVRLFQEHSADIVCVILDLNMPVRDGLSAFRAMKEIRPGVQVILCSGYSEQEATHRFLGEGLAAFLQKPYRLRDLEEKLKLILPTTSQ